VFLLVAVLVGVLLSQRVGLAAPVASALVARGPVAEALRPQLMPGLVGGLLCGALLLFVARLAPPALSRLEGQFPLTAAARVLYGGITEELLVRWGLLTPLMWLFSRLTRHARSPQLGVVAAAIIVSAVLFGAGHLPAASALLHGLTPAVSAYIIGANTIFGLLAGWLFWRYGLESAMLAHVTAHVVLIAAG